MTLIYKICSAAEWREAEGAGVFRGSPIDLADGFIHFSTAGQAAETASKHFGDRTDLLLVAVASDALGAALRFEPSRGGASFPHLHGPLPLDAVRDVADLPLGPDGAHVFPPAVLAAACVFEPQTEGWRPVPGDDFIGLVGPLWSRPPDEASAGAPDEVRRYGLLAERRHLNRGGIVHGGMVMTFADHALGLAAFAANGGRRQVTVHLDTHFISGVKEGEFVEARCRVLRRTTALLFMAAELGVGDRVVATATGVWKMRSEGASTAVRS